jgi:hypothetical protein
MKEKEKAKCTIDSDTLNRAQGMVNLRSWLVFSLGGSAT